MLATVIGMLVLLAAFLGAYLYGVKVGLAAGRAAGIKQADAEWQAFAQHGAV
jgi:hypothetical protein